MNGAALIRLRGIVLKELWAVLRDPRARISLLLPPILQLFVFGFAATLEVKHVTLGVYDRDGGAVSREVTERVAASPVVRRLVRLDSDTAVRAAIDERRVLAVLDFDANFSRDLAAGRPARVLGIFDGRRSNASQIVGGYLASIVAGVGAEMRPTAAGGGSSIVSHWFNPNLEYLWFVMPSLVVVIAAVSVLSVTAQSIARERELGTFDQLLVSPLRTHEILAGKIAPALLLGLANSTLYLILIPTVFGVPFTGSITVFYLALLCFLLALIGVGLFVSILSQTQQQAFLGMFLAVVPLILLSGYASPVDNMPRWLQWVAELDPLKHFLVISEGLFLKDMPASVVLANTWPLAVIGSATLSAAALLFRSRMD